MDQNVMDDIDRENVIYIDPNHPEFYRLLREAGATVDDNGIVTDPGLGQGTLPFRDDVQNGPFEQADDQDSQPISSTSDSDQQDVRIEPVDAGSPNESYLADSDVSDGYFSDDRSPSTSAPGSPLKKCVKCGRAGISMSFCCDCWKERKDYVPEPPKPFRKRTTRMPEWSTVKKLRLSDDDEDDDDSDIDENDSEDEEESNDDFDSLMQLLTKVNAMLTKVAAKLASLKPPSQPDAHRECSSNPSCQAPSDSPLLSTSASSPGSVSAPLCKICRRRPQDGCFVHALISHGGFCFECAEQQFKICRRCPVCRRRTEKVVRNYVC